MERHFFYKRSQNAKSIRKNCFWIEVNGNKYLVSYETVVCVISAAGYFHKFWDDYTVTTLNQINCFINQFEDVFSCVDGTKINGFNKKEWLDYPTEKPIENDIRQIAPYIPTIEWNCCYKLDYVKKINYAN